MSIPLCGTFDYVAVVPELSNQAPWAVQLREPIDLTGDDRTDDRLVGHSPTLEISDGGITPDVPKSVSSGPVRPLVLRSRLTLRATARKHARVASVAFHVDRALTMALLPGDVLFLTRTGSTGLGLSIVRRGQLIAAVGAGSAVPLGDHVRIRIPFDIVEEAEAVFRKYDPDFRIRLLPVEIRVGERTRIAAGQGRLRLEPYDVFVQHGFAAMPGAPAECVAVSLMGHVPDVVAIASAQLMDFPDPLEIVQWPADQTSTNADDQRSWFRRARTIK